MTSFCIKGKRIRKINLPKEYDISNIQIGILVMEDEDKRVGLAENGDVVLPSGAFGTQSRKNAYGYTYADKSKPKERRYVSTNWMYPFGNTNASMVAADIYRVLSKRGCTTIWNRIAIVCERQWTAICYS